VANGSTLAQLVVKITEKQILPIWVPFLDKYSQQEHYYGLGVVEIPIAVLFFFVSIGISFLFTILATIRYWVYLIPYVISYLILYCFYQRELSWLQS